MVSMATPQEPHQQNGGGVLDAEVDEVIAACAGDMRAAVQALVTLVHIREAELADARSAASFGFWWGRP